MKNIYTAILFLFVFSYSYGQVNTDHPILEVVGTARISVTPDIGILRIGISTVNETFSSSITNLNSKTVDVTKQLSELGFKAAEIKTTDFEVNKNTVYRRNESIDSGYIATQQVKVDFPNNKNVITRILQVFSDSETDFNLSFDFKLSDSLKLESQNKIIELAVEDAFQRGKRLAKSADIQLSSIERINYGNNYYSGMREANDTQQLYEMAASSADNSIVGFTPNDIIFIDNVLVVWLIE